VPKEPKPFYRADRKRWYVQLGTKQVNLGGDEAAARLKYHAVMAGRDAAPANPAGAAALVCEVLDDYLVWCEANRAPRTYAGHL
jgi:hypothetical protein